MKRNMEILVASFDVYSDIWSTFVEIFKKISQIVLIKLE